MISLKVIHRAAAARASHYYAEQKDDYYSRDGTSAQWQGKAAHALGLTGVVKQEAFLAALRGDFGSDVKLSRSVRLDAKARAALDITFSPPKSVSIDALVGKDGKVIDAHDHAVTKALDYIEMRLVRARQKVNGVTTMEKTGNAVIAKFRHETARPTAGAYSDPQLHTHALVMNVTRRADGAWTALANDDIYRLKRLAEAVYHAELATALEKAGKRLRYENKSFELAHISREQIESFSKRSQDINAALAGMGETRQSASRELKQAIALKTRNGKKPEIDRADLQQDWERQATDLSIDFSPRARTPDKAPITAEALARAADKCLDLAIKHHTERESVMDGDAILKTALLHTHGSSVKMRDLEAAVKRSLDKGHLILGTLQYRHATGRDGEGFSRAQWVERMVRDGMSKEQARVYVRRAVARGELILTGARYTTQVTREREKRILQIEREGRAAVQPILNAEAAQNALDGRSLKPGQQAAAQLILSTQDRFVGVQGLAGTGKSHMLAQVQEIAQSAGYSIQAVASYGKQIQALRDLGMESRTVASVLEARKGDRFKLDARTILVIDEAGVVPTRMMERLMKMAETDGARVVMLGDTEQTKAIEAGRPFHQLQDAGMETACMGDIIRQKSPELKAAVELAAVGRASESLGVIDDKHHALAEIKEDGDRYATIAERYAQRTEAERRETLIVTGTNESRNAINEATHWALGLGDKGFDFTMLSRRDTTQAERLVAKFYEVGDFIQPERDYKRGDLKDGQLYRVIGTVADKNNALEVEHVETQTRTTFNPARASKLSVYRPQTAELSAGDWVRVTRNDAKLDLVNGERFEVLAVTPTSVTIGNRSGRRVVLDATALPLHLDRAYASTSHSVQGLTCDTVLINSESFSRTTQKDVYYVAISRARHKAEIFTDNAGRLHGAVNRLEGKTAALDIGLETLPRTPQKQARLAREARGPELRR